MKWIKIVGALLWLFGSLSAGQAEWIEIPLGFRPAPPDESGFPVYEMKRPRIALALSGGGARGLSQIGVLKVFERHGLPIDYIAGTSMGAVIGGLSAVGYSASDLEAVVKKIDWNEIIRNSPPRQELFLSQKAQRSRSLFQFRLDHGKPIFSSAYTSGHNLNALLTDLVYNAPFPPSADFDRLKIPFRAVATDLLTGEKTVFRDGSLVDAIHASMAIPLLFEPVEIDSRWLVDGGLVQNLPVEEAKAFHPDLVIAVDTSSKLRRKEDLDLPWQVADQVTTILHQEILREQFSTADIQIQPELGDVRNTDFSDVDSLIQAGVRAAEAAIPKIDSLLSGMQVSQTSDSLRIATLSIEGADSLDPDSLMTLLAQDSTGRVPLHQIAWQGQALYQTGAFEDVHVFLDTTSHGLLFRLTPTQTVREVLIRGNTLFTTQELLALFETRPGETLNLFRSRQDCIRMLKKYHEAGFSLAKISSSRIENGIWTIRLDEGLISRIRLFGNARTRPSMIRRDLRIRTGDIFNAHSLSESIENLYATGYFESIRFHIEKGGVPRNLIFYFREKPFSIVRFGMRYDLERQTKGFLEYAEENIAGLGFLGTAFAHYGSWDQKLGLKMETDRLLNSLWTFESRSTLYKDRYRYYQDGKETGVYTESGWKSALSFGQQMQKFGTVWIRIGFEKTRTLPERGQSISEERVLLTHLALYSVVDTRDEMPFPKNGRYYILEYESGLPFLGSDRSYFRLFSSISGYQSFSRWTFSPQIEWGTVDLTAPFTKQFRIGGLDTFLGLPESSKIGRRFIVINTTLRYQLPWIPKVQQYLSLRYDLGGVWGRYSQINSEDFMQGVGLIWSAKTPLGPTHVGWGHTSDGESRLYFSLGYTF